MIAVVALVFAATGHADVLGVAELVTGTVIVQVVPVDLAARDRDRVGARRGA